PKPVIIPPATGDHSDAACSDGHNGASRGPTLPNADSRPATNNAAAIAANQGGNTPANVNRGALRAYQVPIPDVRANNKAPSNAPTIAPSNSIDTWDPTGSAVLSCICANGQAFASARSARTKESAATHLTARVSQRPFVHPSTPSTIAAKPASRKTMPALIFT